MPNHVHLILVPPTANGLARAIGATHRRYTGFGERASALDRALVPGTLCLSGAGRRAPDAGGALRGAQSGAGAAGAAAAALAMVGPAGASRRLRDGLVTVAPLLQRLGHVTALVDTEPEAVALARLRAAETMGRALGSDAFVTRLEGLLQRHLRRRKAGRKARIPTDAGDLFAGMDRDPKRSGNM